MSYCVACKDAGCSECEGQRIAEVKLAEASAWPPRECVRALADAVAHLLRDHDCDAHGHEQVKRSHDEARAWLGDEYVPLDMLPCPRPEPAPAEVLDVSALSPEDCMTDEEIERWRSRESAQLDLYAMPLTNQCGDEHRSDLGGHHCTMTKGHSGSVHVEVDPVFGNPRWAWVRVGSTRVQGREGATPSKLAAYEALFDAAKRVAVLQPAASHSRTPDEKRRWTVFYAAINDVETADSSGATPESASRTAEATPGDPKLAADLKTLRDWKRPEPAPAEAPPMRCPSCGVHTLPPVPVWRCPDAACGDSLVGPPMDPVMASQRRESPAEATPVDAHQYLWDAARKVVNEWWARNIEAQTPGGRDALGALDDALSDALPTRPEPAPAEEPWNGDKPLPEDEEIKAAHPMRTGRHDLYAEAMRLVGARHSKGGLVELVNMLLYRAENLYMAIEQYTDVRDRESASPDRDPSLWEAIETAFLSAVHRGDGCPFCLARTDGTWPYCVHFAPCILHDWTEKLAAKIDEQAVRSSGNAPRHGSGHAKVVAEILDATEAVIRDGEVDFDEVTTPEKAREAQLELIAHIRDQLATVLENVTDKERAACAPNSDRPRYCDVHAMLPLYPDGYCIAGLTRKEGSLGG